MILILSLIFLVSTLKSIDNLLKEGDIRRADSLAQVLVTKYNNESTYRSLYYLYKRHGLKNRAVDILNEGRKKLKDPTLFSQEFYILYARERDYENAFIELLNLSSNGSKWAQKELLRYKKLLGMKKVEKLVKKWGKKTGREINEILFKFYFEGGDLDKAISVARRGSDSLLLVAAEEALLKDMPDLALKALRKVKNKGASWEFMKACALKKLGKYDDALLSFRRADSLGIPSQDSIASLLLYNLKEPKEVLKLNGVSPVFKLEALIKLGEFEKADSLFSGYTSDPEVLYRLILINEVLGRRGRVDTLSKAFLKMYPRHEHANDVIFVLYEQEEISEDWETLTEVKKRFLMGDFEAVDSIMRKYNGRNKGYLYIYWGLALEKLDKPEVSFTVFKEAGRDSSFAGAYALYRASLVALDYLRNDQLARETLKELILRFPDSPYAEIARKIMNELKTQESSFIFSNTSRVLSFNSSRVPLLSIT